MTSRRGAGEEARPPLDAPVAVRITGIDEDGEALGRPIDWPGPPPIVFMRPERRDQPALAPGDRVIAQLKRIGVGRYQGSTIRRLSETPGRVLGRFRAIPGGGGRIEPADRRQKAEWRVPPGEAADAATGEIVLASPLPHGGTGLKPARVIERLGPAGDARGISLICIHTNEIPDQFPAEVLAEAARAGPVPLGAREDLRDLPLVTIDGEDARDFDDAVFAAPEADGFRIVVAIADVAHYVPSGGALDREARLRGNSVYFADRVVPMLPEALSTNWCSLLSGQERGCVFAEMRIDARGRLGAHRFARGLMRSAARLTYAEAERTRPAALFAAYDALATARQARGTLDLDLPERQVMLEAGAVAEVRFRARLDSHRLIEAFMILANVAAAETLEGRPCVYRVHAPPTDDKLDALRAVLHGLGLGLPAGDQLHPRDLERVLQQAAGSPEEGLVHEVILRAQSQAEYAAANIGHFGLALSRYAHFTSPIRRYADLLVHRALVGDAVDPAGLATVATHLGTTERRAAAAERESIERYLAAYMSAKSGQIFAARVSGVQRFGIFVTVRENGASGLVPVRSLPDDLWVFDASTQTLAGRRTRMSVRLGQDIDVRLAECDPLTGSLLFAIPPPDTPLASTGRR